jgi:hypothetical protein
VSGSKKLAVNAEKQMQLAVNAAVDQYRLEIKRQQMMVNPGFAGGSMTPGLDAKRGQSWCEFGWKAHLDFIDFYKLYSRGGISAGAVNKLAGRCWSTNPWLVEGDKDDKDMDVTPWEESLKPVLRQGRLWRAFAEADKRRLVGRYSGIILRVRDSRPLNMPVMRGRGLKELIVAWAGSLYPVKYVTDMAAENYGDVAMWRYKEPSLGGQPARDVDVHPDRVFILGDWRADAIGFLEPVFNNFVNLEKTEGGSGESILKNSNRSIHVNFDGTVDLRNVAAMYGVDLNGLQQKFNDVAREVNQGNDILFVTQGAQATPMVANVPNPQPIYDINLQSVSAGVDIPSKILVGNQTGERASTEDEAYMNRRCQGRRVNELNYEIQDFFEKLVDLRIIDAAPNGEFVVEWDDLNEPTTSEKLDNAAKMSKINAEATAGGMGTEIFSREQILGAVGMEDMVDVDADPLPDRTEEDEEEEEEVANG